MTNINARINLKTATLAQRNAVTEDGTPLIISDSGSYPFAFEYRAGGAWRVLQQWNQILDSISDTAATAYGIGLLEATSGDVQEYLGIKSRLFGCLYMSTEGNTAQSIPAGTAYTKIAPFDSAIAGGVDTTANAANGTIMLSRAGRFMVDFSRSLLVGSSGVLWHVAVFVDGVVQPQTVQSIKTANSGSQMYADMSVPIICAEAGAVVDVRVHHDSASPVSITYEHATLSITAID